MRRVTPGKRTLALLGVAALAVLALCAAAPFVTGNEYGPPDIPVRVAADVAGGSFLGVGLVAAWRRPNSRIGLLMMAVGLAWFSSSLTWIRAPLAWSAGFMIQDLWMPILGHLAVSFPSGRLRGRADRLVVAIGYGWWLAAMLADTLTWHPSYPMPWARNVFAALGDQHLNDVLGQALSVADVAVVVLVSGTVLVHWRRASRPGRRVLAPVAWAVIPIGIWLCAMMVARSGLASAGAASALTGVGYLTAAAVPFGFLIGLQRTHLGRGAVGDLVVQLGSRAEPAERLDAALARVLGDPTIRVLYRVGDGGHVDAAGQPAQLPRAGGGRAVTTVDQAGAPVAALVHDPALLDEPELLEATVAAARLAIDNARLQAEVRAQLAEVRTSRARILHAGDVERRRVERNLHDGAQQRLVMLAFALRTAQAQADGDAELHAALDEAAQQLKEALADLRALAQGLHPAVLERGGLAAAVESAVRRSPVPAELSEVPRERFAPDVEAAAYYVVSEALANAGKHAEATCVRVRVHRRGQALRVEVADDGRGGADASGSGLTGLADRVAVAGGTFAVTSPPGSGTVITAELPCGT